MTPLRARLILLAIMALFLATAGNALFLQERSRVLRDQGGRFSLAQATAEAPVAAATPVPPQPSAGTRENRLEAALQRVLLDRGYADQLRVPGNGLRLAVLAYEFDHGMPLTGEPADALLKRLLFDPDRAPRGLFADRAEASQRLVLETQKVLLGLGFFRGALSGRMDVWTADAVKDFERHRALPVTGRLTEATLLELISYSGQSLKLSSG